LINTNTIQHKPLNRKLKKHTDNKKKTNNNDDDVHNKIKNNNNNYYYYFYCSVHISFRYKVVTSEETSTAKNYSTRNIQYTQLQNVAIANALQLDRPSHASPFRFNYDDMPSLNWLNLSIAVL